MLHGMVLRVAQRAGACRAALHRVGVRGAEVSRGMAVIP
jgi:hypothetical protein